MPRPCDKHLEDQTKMKPLLLGTPSGLREVKQVLAAGLVCEQEPRMLSGWEARDLARALEAGPTGAGTTAPSPSSLPRPAPRRPAPKALGTGPAPT